MLIKILTILVILFGSLAILSQYVGPPIFEYITKPLTTILILVVAVLVGRSAPSTYKYLIFAGLLFSLAGDVFLMLPGDRFILGLVSFLIAQVFYILAFTSGRGFSFGLLSGAVVLAYGVLVYSLLHPHLGQMRLPVIAYMVVILVMAWQAWERWGALGTQAALLGFIGAALFVLSDTILAMNRFRGAFSSARALTLLTYWAAQWLIANSIG